MRYVRNTRVCFLSTFFLFDCWMERLFHLYHGVKYDVERISLRLFIHRG